MILAPATLAGLLSMPSCSGIDRRVLYGLVATESAGDPLAIHDDTAGRSYFPRDPVTAATLVVRLDRARHAFSVGLTQVENSNWARYRVTGVQLLDARTNVAVGCAIYRENLSALRAYNTGTPAPSALGDRYAAAVFVASRIVTPRQVPPRGPVRVSLKRRPASAPVRHPLAGDGFGYSVRARQSTRRAATQQTAAR